MARRLGLDPVAIERRALLLRSGPLLLGADWQRPLARLLGPHHPDGARDAIDDRLVRRWATGDRPIPAWVIGVVAAEIGHEIAAHGRQLRELRAVEHLLRATEEREKVE